MSDYLRLINTLDIDALKEEVSISKPFPYFYIDNFLENQFAEDVYNSFPDFKQAKAIGKNFNGVNEINKVQVTDESKFSKPIAKLNELMRSQEFLEILSDIMGIPNLVADKKLTGGGIHETSEGGRLDVHVDFNFNKDLQMFRRVNILIYFNKDWKREYGGILDLWDKDVKKCHAEILPAFNRMACFATSEISYHGVTPLKCPEGVTRKSFAGYYYTKDAPKDWDGTYHSTVFKSRPNEWLRGSFAIPMSNLLRRCSGVCGRSVNFVVNKLTRRK